MARLGPAFCLEIFFNSRFLLEPEKLFFFPTKQITGIRKFYPSSRESKYKRVTLGICLIIFDLKHTST